MQVKEKCSLFERHWYYGIGSIYEIKPWRIEFVFAYLKFISSLNVRKQMCLLVHIYYNTYRNLTSLTQPNEAVQGHRLQSSL